jgi:hypothetical protein
MTRDQDTGRPAGRPQADVRVSVDDLIVPLVAVAFAAWRILQRYVAHFDHINREPTPKFNDRGRGFFERWLVKFSAE